MSLWFSASAVTLALQSAWGLSPSQVSWLTIAVQLGFVAGALFSAVANLSERIAPPVLLRACAALGAAINFVIPAAIDDAYVRRGEGLITGLGLRLATGLMLAAVYPAGMKLMASWFKQGRGLAIGVLVGALTVGSASPHLINALPLDDWSWRLWPNVPAWRAVMMTASGCALAAAVVAALFVRPGPHVPAASRFDWRYFAQAFTEPALRRANFGYLGHMFELYAMWTWVPQLLIASYAAAEWNVAAARLAGFATVAIGGLGCVLAGLTADRAGRCWTTIASLAASGSCALVGGSLTGHPALLTTVCLIWGFAVVADSAQFSAAVSELCDPQFVGTALTIQTCAGFLLTTLTIRAVPTIRDTAGWPWALGLLALGPLFGIYHMLRLRGMPAAERLAGGRR